MYLKYWGFKDPPFENVPNRKLFFRSDQHEEAVVRLMYAVKNLKGAALLTGDVGFGKTTISRVLEKRLSKDQYNFSRIFNPALEPVDFIKSILIKLGENADNDSKTILINKLHDRLSVNASNGINTVLIIDEAHLIPSRETFEELRMLLNMQSEYQFLITLILMGQLPLIELIEEQRSLKERISIKYHLESLSLKDTARYILFRLKNVGSKKGFFSKQAVLAIHNYSQGIPLRINNLCDRSLLLGMINNVSVINSSIIETAIEDIR
jgi:general secretion pathway protein A